MILPVFDARIEYGFLSIKLCIMASTFNSFVMHTIELHHYFRLLV